jgi:hypothetical protein
MAGCPLGSTAMLEYSPTSALLSTIVTCHQSADHASDPIEVATIPRVSIEIAFDVRMFISPSRAWLALGVP